MPKTLDITRILREQKEQLRAGFQDRLVMTTSITLRIYVQAQKSSTFNIKFSRLRLIMSCCGARNFLLALAHKISTAATPYASLLLPLAALGNVPTSHTPPEDRQARCVLRRVWVSSP